MDALADATGWVPDWYKLCSDQTHTHCNLKLKTEKRFHLGKKTLIHCLSEHQYTEYNMIHDSYSLSMLL